MHPNFQAQVAALQQLAGAALRARYAEVFGEPPRSGNKTWLVKRIAWRLQALAEGDLSQRARRRAAELANDADLRLFPPKPGPSAPSSDSDTVPAAATRRPADPRLPPAGNLLTRLYKGQRIQVRILLHGFEFQGRVFPTLSAVAKAITGSHCSGFLFFRLLTPKGAAS
jgi:hypothetical protein